MSVFSGPWVKIEEEAADYLVAFDHLEGIDVLCPDRGIPWPDGHSEQVLGELEDAGLDIVKSEIAAGLGLVGRLGARGVLVG